MKRQVTVDDILFDSKLESQHYLFFKNHPDITILKLQPSFELFEAFTYDSFQTKKKAKFRNISYTGDFLIKWKDIEKPIVIEVKGWGRPDYKLRYKLFLYKYNKEYNFFESNKLKDVEDYFNEK